MFDGKPHETNNDLKCSECGQFFTRQHELKDAYADLRQRGYNQLSEHKDLYGEEWHDRAIVRGKYVCGNCHETLYLQASVDYEDPNKVIVTPLLLLDPHGTEKKKVVAEVEHGF
jgi:hypothetical protein